VEVPKPAPIEVKPEAKMVPTMSSTKPVETKPETTKPQPVLTPTPASVSTAAPTIAVKVAPQTKPKTDNPSSYSTTYITVSIVLAAVAFVGYRYLKK
jgi:lysozyme family protein